ncbi:PAS domain-containing protein [Sphingomonas quercus]|uniref:PAS domain-containing protein n=1 Tax=Sphingomonas quercus TaxID=2842451 RepID=A0ABS6BE82_9SPHN|nr:PAS domain-containing protein [Sphingomonas quercus]MBU3076618.1 PAS domain-containing protein [Sphingomonas quercus]
MYQGKTPRFVSAAEITRNFGMWQDRAAQGPLVVTHHGRPRVMMLAVEHYEELAAGHGPAAEEEDLESARLSVVLGQIGSAFAAFDTELRFVRLNAAAVAHFGQPEERLIGRTPEEVFTGREAMIAGHLREALRTGEEMQVDLPAGPNGERLLRMRLFPYPGGVGVTFRNVAGLRNAERAEQEHAALAQARVTHGGVGVGRLGPRATFEHVEEPLAQMAGFAPERLGGVRFTDLLSLPSRAAASDAIEAVLTGQGARAFDSIMLVNGGGELPVRIALAELRDGFAISGAVVMVSRG